MPSRSAHVGGIEPGDTGHSGLDTFVLAYGFLARVLTGPKASPMGQLATRVVAPKILRRFRAVAGPPKQFAQAVGLIFSITVIVLIYGFGLVGAAYVVLGVLVLFASLEAFVGFCMGCFAFGYLMRWGIISAEVCERCNDIMPGIASSQA